MPTETPRRQWPLILTAVVLFIATGAPVCPPPKQCVEGPNNISIDSATLVPGGTIELQRGQKTTLDLQVRARVKPDAADYKQSGLFCFGALSGQSGATRATDRQLGGGALVWGGRQFGSTGIDAECTSNGIVKVTTVQNPAGIVTGNRDLNIYAIPLPSNRNVTDDPASNTVLIRCK